MITSTISKHCYVPEILQNVSRWFVDIVNGDETVQLQLIISL